MTFLGVTCLAGQPLDKSGQPLATWQPLDSSWAATVLDSWAATGQVWTAIQPTWIRFRIETSKSALVFFENEFGYKSNKLEKSKSAVVLVENGDSLKSYIFVNEQKCSSVARKQRFCQKSVVFGVVFGAGPPHQPCILMWNNRWWVIHDGLLKSSKGCWRISCM